MFEIANDSQLLALFVPDSTCLSQPNVLGVIRLVTDTDKLVNSVNSGEALVLQMQDTDMDAPGGLSASAFIQQTDPPKIRVVVRKRPLNHKASGPHAPSIQICMLAFDCRCARAFQGHLMNLCRHARQWDRLRPCPPKLSDAAFWDFQMEK